MQRNKLSAVIIFSSGVIVHVSEFARFCTFSTYVLTCIQCAWRFFFVNHYLIIRCVCVLWSRRLRAFLFPWFSPQKWHHNRIQRIPNWRETLEKREYFASTAANNNVLFHCCSVQFEQKWDEWRGRERRTDRKFENASVFILFHSSHSKKWTIQTILAHIQRTLAINQAKNVSFDQLCASSSSSSFGVAVPMPVQSAVRCCSDWKRDALATDSKWDENQATE